MEKLNNFAYELSKATKVDEVDRIDTKYKDITFELVKIEDDIGRVQPTTRSPTTVSPHTLTEDEEDFIFEYGRLNKHLNETRTKLSDECFVLIERPSLQHDCYLGLKELNNLAYEMTKTTVLDEVERVKKDFNRVLDSVTKIEKDIGAHF